MSGQAWVGAAAVLLGGFGLASDPPAVAPPPRAVPDRKDPNSAVAQSVRWTLRFRTRNGKDYVDQLAAIGATLLYRHPEKKTEYWLIPDLRKPDARRRATDDDLDALAKKPRFFDRDPKSVRSVAEALGLDFTPTQLIAFLPDELREKLAGMEKEFRSRDPKDIKETRFQVEVKDGKYTITVFDQIPQP